MENKTNQCNVKVCNGKIYLIFNGKIDTPKEKLINGKVNISMKKIRSNG